MAHNCLFCGSPLGEGRHVTRTLISGHVRVQLMEYPCPGCDEGTEVEVCRLGQFCDRALDLLPEASLEGTPIGRRVKVKAPQPMYEAALDDQEGWVFALL